MVSIWFRYFEFGRVRSKCRIIYISGFYDMVDLFYRVEVGIKIIVYGKDFFVNNGGNGEIVEVVGKCFLEFDVVVMFVFVVEIIDMVDGGIFVVVMEDEEVFGVFDFVGE